MLFRHATRSFSKTAASKVQQVAATSDSKIDVNKAFSPVMDFGNPALYELLTESAKRSPNNPCVYYQGKTLTYAEVDDLSSRFASGLKSLGLEKGDRVAMVLPNTPQFVISYFGIMKAGGVVVPCSVLYKPEELEHQLKDSGATFVIGTNNVVTSKSKKDGKTVKTSTDLFESLEYCREKLDIKQVITTSVTDYLPGVKSHLAWLKGIKMVARAGAVDFKRLVKSNGPIESLNLVSDSRNETALIQYTGGTTGVSKGAMLTNYNLYSNARYISASFPMTGSDVSMCVLPLYHIYGMTATMNSAISAGAKLVLLPNFHVKEVMKAIEKQDVTIFCAVPAIYNAIISNPKSGRYDLSSVRACVSGGAGLPEAIRDKFVKLTGGTLVEGYGLTEASPLAICNPLHDGAAKAGSIGVPIPETEVRIVDIDDHSKILGVGEAGELAIRGPQVMKGYYNRPEETAKVMIDDGFMLTGDVARVDENGRVYIEDRKKDMINVGGLKVYPKEVEEVLFSNGAVVDAAAVAYPDSFSGEVVKAFIVLKPGASMTEKELVDYCSEKLAKYKVPRHVEFVSELPKTLIGKVIKRELRDST